MIAQERDIVHSRLIGRRDTTAVRPAASVTVGVGDCEPHASTCLSKVVHSRMIHPPASGWLPCRTSIKGNVAADRPGQADRETPRLPADRQLTRDHIAIVSHARCISDP